MPAYGRHAVLPAMLVATMAMTARAQKQCEIDENTPNQVAVLHDDDRVEIVHFVGGG
jgi:hypothetical protein